MTTARTKTEPAPSSRPANDLFKANERRCGEAAKIMMEWLLPSFELVAPLPPYPPAWETLTDQWDHPVWAAAKEGRAQYVISENSHHYPKPHQDGRRIYDGIEYLGARVFLDRLAGDLE